ncbi:a-pheromone processing metallopeptidase Ste23 [Histoplasma capsulatum var. duboisii H88]|uniref:A-pheromone processing metallopeptidase Ste23 n=2 Tax=Ajellomyces capsulatus TaxID=5037 RepID=F0UNU7_AJEC8|nr:a-pheromone processing metallopeptidase Ste23 [Histoplasma capsulatum var. duboisii H88]QSS53033.1 a-pheromone processing metallopeptidase Ste23 [Histoplasma capsulatum var. duboisii H88]
MSPSHQARLTITTAVLTTSQACPQLPRWLPFPIPYPQPVSLRTLPCVASSPFVVNNLVSSSFAVIGRHLSTSTTLPAQQPLHHHQQQQQQIHPLFPKPQHTMAIVERLTEDLEKPSVDDRSYRVIRLPNKLEALLVHDPDTDKASASVNVNVGNFSDDDDLPGIAHAVEHALFMGTKKYPKENAYNQYLAAHSGHSNAYTGATETNYFFEVAATAISVSKSTQLSTPATPIPAEVEPLTDGLSRPTIPLTATAADSAVSSSSDLVPPLYGALDRFAQFFIAPLFLEATLDRELRAVDSENKKNLQNDDWRLMQLNKSLSNPEHPYHHFSTGNLQTLRDGPQSRGVNVRDEFIRFYETNYSANRMKLVVLGRESLDELEGWVAELFADVKNKNLPQNRWDDVQPYTPADLQKICFAKPVMDTRSLDIFFTYQDEENLYDSKPARYISHLIGHEGPGSILAHIKAKGWAYGLSAGPIPICPGSAFFTISIRLTEDGISNYQEVIKTVFQYISILKSRVPEEWIFEEMKTLAEVDFKFRQKSPASGFTSSLSSVMQKPFPREWLLSGPYLLRKFDGQAIQRALDCFRIDSFNIELVSQTYPGNWDSKEKWYGTEYRVEKLPTDLLSEIGRILEAPSYNPMPELHLPHKNEFLPTRFDVEKKEVAQPAKRPTLIRNDDRVRAWFKKDDTFYVPKASVEIILRNPLAYATPGNNVLTKLACGLIRDDLQEYSYDAELGGLDYGLSPSVFGLEVSVSGYNDKMAVLLEKVLHSMRDFKVKPDRFKIVKQRMADGFSNSEYQQPYHQVGNVTRYLTAEKTWITEQLAAELEHIEPEDVAAFFPQLLRQTHIELLGHGNLYREDVLKMGNMVESAFHARPLPRSQWNVRRNIIIAPGSNYIYEKTLKDPANINHCIEYYLFVGDITDPQLRAKLLLFGQLTNEPAFDQLRTQEQLGYVVWSGIRYGATTLGYRVIIQSEKSNQYLESRIDAFLVRFAQALDSMTDEEFEDHKRSLINKRLEKLKNLNSEMSRFWSHITSEYFDFTQHETDAEKVAGLTKGDIVEFYQQYIDPQSRTRAKLSVHLNAQSSAPDDERKKKVVEKLSDLVSSSSTEFDSGKFKASFANVNFMTTDVMTTKDAIVSTLKGFLETELKLDSEKVTSIVEPATHVINEILQGLGIKAIPSLPSTTGGAAVPATEKVNVTVNGAINGTTNGAANGHAVIPTPSSKPGQPTYITNVSEYKARLAVSAGPSPIVDLSEFEEIDPKL